MPHRYFYLLMVGLLCLPGVSTAADDAAEFLEAMRKHGMHDLALDYLDYARTDRLVSEEFKKKIPYERGTTLLAKWQETVATAEKDRIAAQARSELTEYANANPSTPEAADALQRMAGLLTVTAMNSLAVLEMKPVVPDDAPEIKKTARGQLAEARTLFEQVEKSIQTQLDSYPDKLDRTEQAEQFNERRQFRRLLAQVRMQRSENLLQQASTYGQGDAAAKALYEKARDEFQKLFDIYDGFPPESHEAKLGLGKALKALGDTKRADTCFEDIIVICHDVGAYRYLTTEALVEQGEMMLAEGKLDALLEKQGVWLATARGMESRQPAWLDLKFLVAETMRQKIDSEGVKDGDKRKMITEARDLYTDLAQLPSKHQMVARQILAESFPVDPNEAERVRVKTFDEALQAAKDSINLMTVAKQTLPVAKANNPEGVEVLQQQADKGFQDAMYYLSIAQTLVDDDTPLAELNESRWLTCYLMWEDKQFYRTAVLAGFIARRYPEDPKAKMAAKLAMISYQQLFQQALEQKAPGAGEAEVARLKDMASFITRRWSGSALANEAFSLLMVFSIRDQKFEEALELLKELPEEQRPIYQAKIANAMWEMQLRASIEGDQSIDRQALKSRAVELLDDSFAKLAQDPTAADTLAASTLYLSQARLDEGNYQQAIDMLENPNSGAIALSKTNNPIASRQAYAMEAYKGALRAYVSVIPPQTEKAVETMTALEEAAGGGGEKLTRVYLGLGVQLQQQIDELNGEGKTDEAKRVGEAFVAFLDKLTERGSTDPVVRQWISQTYYRLAEGLAGDPTAEEQRQTYYARAADAYKLLLSEETIGNFETNQLLALRLQYANALRHAGKFKDAMQVFEIILTEKEMMIEAQTDAAYTLQEWGASGVTAKLKEAVTGTGPLNDKGKPTIWGWNYLGKVAASVASKNASNKQVAARFKNLFYECWLNIARVRYLRSESEQGNAKKKSLSEAKKVASTMVRDYPALLDTPLKAEYDELLKSIQRGEGAPTLGLKELLDE
ncbi:tetratricopeptide repeat protein [Aeoliella mucimassa]|uniref:Tetratricopeptide repeat protein n=1 Tax=Aeoliella mucimassa TaxID=2527972 RepID=A0A518AKS6_9BACT|nr:hypothetical protein [Aeoliella mucimassa]QDU55296.1 hypothetical protein Pan181_14850 [Aeoliella mucimassa]